MIFDLLLFENLAWGCVIGAAVGLLVGAVIDAHEFQKYFMDWINEVAKMTTGQVIATSGKTERRSHDRSNGKNPSTR